jgi:5-methylcytosine-specific restriction protein A
MRNPSWNEDEIILALDLYFALEWNEMEPTCEKVITLSKLLNAIHLAIGNSGKGQNYRNPNGVSMKLQNFKALDPRYQGKGLGRGSKLDQEVFQRFQNDQPDLRKQASQIRELLSSNQMLELVKPINEDDWTGDPEGGIIYRLHKTRERSGILAQKKRSQVLAATGKLECEVCSFDFKSTYGDLGNEFCEVHHRTPLSQLSGETKTQLEDLAVVCSNCHRMLHRMKEMSMDGLRELINDKSL